MRRIGVSVAIGAMLVTGQAAAEGLSFSGASKSRHQLFKSQAALLDGAGKIGYEAQTTGLSDFPTE